MVFSFFSFIFIKFTKLDWRRRLILRHKLTMHTAFNRPDNAEPASVTAIAISKYFVLSDILFKTFYKNLLEKVSIDFDI